MPAESKGVVVDIDNGCGGGGADVGEESQCTGVCGEGAEVPVVEWGLSTLVKDWVLGVRSFGVGDLCEVGARWCVVGDTKAVNIQVAVSGKHLLVLLNLAA